MQPDAQLKASAKTVRFGLYTLDLSSGELMKSGIRVRLQEQSFRVLRILLERHGEIVARDELRAQVWPDTFVDFDFALNTTIRKIRSALGFQPVPCCQDGGGGPVCDRRPKMRSLLAIGATPGEIAKLIKRVGTRRAG